VGFENVLGQTLPADSLAPIDESIRVTPSGADELTDWIDVVVTGFDTPDTQGLASHESFDRKILEEAITDLASSDGFSRYFARLEGELAGGASMRLFEGVALLTGAATLPDKRRRGVQSALLSSRLADAGRLGCDVAVVTTQPGSKSQQNAQRQGFELLYTRAVLVRASD
jgi:N-acetylglutamate synthase-like GNAT family acetyltransferase